MVDAVLTTKIAVLVLFFVAAMLCGLFPLLLGRLARSWAKRFTAGPAGKLTSALRLHGDLVVSCVMCLGAGVLLATTFTHMIPEVREEFIAIQDAGLLPDIGLPPGELFVCAGFLLVYFIEEMAHVFISFGRRQKRKRKAAINSEVSERETCPEEAAEPAHEHVGHDHAVDFASQHAFRAYLIVIALSVHSIFEGFAAAFEGSAREVWVFFAAIMAHKAIVAFCIGEQLLNTKRSVCFIVSNLSIFSAATPLGVLLGILVARPDQQGGGSMLATGVLQAMAAGTIIYVIFFELLGPEQRKPGPGLVKFLAILVGFVIMLAIHSSGGHAHSHGGHAHSHGGHSNLAGAHMHDVGAHGHGDHPVHNIPHNHGNHADHLPEIERSIATSAPDRGHSHHVEEPDHHDHSDHKHDHSDHHHAPPHHSNHHDHSDHAAEHVHSNHTDRPHHPEHGHPSGESNDVGPPKPPGTPSHGHDHSDHFEQGGDPHHGHSHDEAGHPSHPAEGGAAAGADYELDGRATANTAAGDRVEIRPVPAVDGGASSEDNPAEGLHSHETHHFHGDGHDHRGPTPQGPGTTGTGRS